MIHIEHTFDFLDGYVSVELRQNFALVICHINDEQYVVEDSQGDIADWHDLYGRKWAALNGAALAAAEKKFAREYGKQSIKLWIESMHRAAGDGGHQVEPLIAGAPL